VLADAGGASAGGLGVGGIAGEVEGLPAFTMSTSETRSLAPFHG
jgi:hypothetical protein